MTLKKIIRRTSYLKTTENHQSTNTTSISRHPLNTNTALFNELQLIQTTIGRQDEAAAPVTTSSSSSFFQLFRTIHTHTHLRLPHTLMPFPQSDKTEPRDIMYYIKIFTFLLSSRGLGFDFRSHVSRTPPSPVEIYKIFLFT